MIKSKILGSLALEALAVSCAPAAPAEKAGAPQKPRVIATTGGEVDDRSSMIRILLYTCDFDVASR